MSAPRGFTLVELVVVIMILGILAGVAVGRFTDVSNESNKNTLRASLDVIVSQVEIKTAARRGRLPGMIQASWFQGGKFPQNPYNTSGVPDYNRASNDTLEHPFKIFIEGSAGAFWYNPANGIVRARVGAQRTPALTLELYNQVNGTSLTNPGDAGGAASVGS